METPTNPTYANSDYAPSSGISTITRTQLKRVSLGFRSQVQNGRSFKGEWLLENGRS